jgi:glycosyltransferase involved in cell wall biosynthesis
MFLKISICIPTYNGAIYLKECLDSVCQQTFKDFEIIICDDCSTDQTIGIIDSYLKKDNRIQFYKNEVNLGLVGNWNQCIKKANGEWIKFLFQDDYMEPDCLSRLMSYTNQDAQLIITKRSYILMDNVAFLNKVFYENNVRTLENTNAIMNGNTISSDTISKVAVNNIALNFLGEPSFAVFKKDIVSKLGYFNNEFSQICDLDFFLRIATNYGLTYVPEKLCHFRVHENSATSQNTSSKSYIINNLDPIVMAYQLLYADCFQNFRKNISFFDKIRLKIYFKVRVYEAFIKSKESTINKNTFEAVAKKYSEISSASKAGFFIKLSSQLVLFKRKILKIV